MKNKLLFLIFASGITKPTLSAKTAEHTMVVYVHGTLPFETYRDKKPFKSKMLRYHPFQPITKKGLVPIDKQSNSIPSLYVKYYEHLQSFLKVPQKHQSFYTFGWKGRLQNRSRIKSAEKLYLALLDEMKKQTSKNVKVILLSHSHGGNVCLNLVRAEKKLKKNLNIEKLVLFGSPIQSETKKFVSSKMFKKVYNIYSRGDRIQVADIFSTYDFFSKRSFKRKQKPLPDNLVEIEVKVNNIKPSHAELWLLGYVPFGLYRKKFPIYPVPIAAFTPLLIDDKIVGSAKEVSVNIQKEKNSCLLSFEDKVSKRKTTHIFKDFDKLKNLTTSWTTSPQSK